MIEGFIGDRGISLLLDWEGSDVFPRILIQLPGIGDHSVELYVWSVSPEEGCGEDVTCVLPKQSKLGQASEGVPCFCKEEV